MGLHQFRRAYDPWGGLGVSIVTSNLMYWGDSAAITGSLTTSSGTASRWTIEAFEGDEGDGFFTALPSGAAGTGGWQVNKTITAQGLFSIDTLPSWVRILRTPSHSSMTMRVTTFVGR